MRLRDAAVKHTGSTPQTRLFRERFFQVWFDFFVLQQTPCIGEGLPALGCRLSASVALQRQQIGVDLVLRSRVVEVTVVL